MADHADKTSERRSATLHRRSHGHNSSQGGNISTSTNQYRALTDKMQQKTREERGFHRAEASLPNISPQTSFKLLNPIASTASKLTELLSYLGSRNPRPRPITSKDQVWLMDNVAFRVSDGKKDGSNSGGRWEAEFVAAVLDQKPSCTVIDAVQAVARTIGLDETDADLEVIEQRIIPFLQDILPGREVVALHRGQLRLRLGPGGRNGISSDLRRLPDAPGGTVVNTTAQVPTGADGILTAKTFFAEPEGWAVVSDIDDTIKVTQTSDPIGILRSTFLDEPTPVAGMPDLYWWLQKLITPTAPFFYLSASPYNLYPFLSSFRDMYFPHGQLILRDQSWMSLPGLLTTLTVGTEEYKVSRGEKIHRWLPKRKMIFIGDSTQSDPEAYGELYRAFPGWIKLILIRKVKDIAAIGIESKNEPERFETAFKDVPKEIWHVFEEPVECQKIIECVVAP